MEIALLSRRQIDPRSSPQPPAAAAPRARNLLKAPQRWDVSHWAGGSLPLPPWRRAEDTALRLLGPAEVASCQRRAAMVASERLALESVGGVVVTSGTSGSRRGGSSRRSVRIDDSNSPGRGSSSPNLRVSTSSSSVANVGDKTSALAAARCNCGNKDCTWSEEDKAADHVQIMAMLKAHGLQNRTWLS